MRLEDAGEQVNSGARVLLVDCCYDADSLSRYEFVHPVQRILERAGSSCLICHHSLIGDKDLKGCDKVVLCGTALKDNLYLNHLLDFAWLKKGKKPVLGIGSGMQIIAALFGGEILSRPVPSMGLERIEIVQRSELLGPCREIEVYHLHSLDLSLPEGFRRLAGAGHAPEAFSHITLPIWGLLFHPEVRNRWILENYANL